MDDTNIQVASNWSDPRSPLCCNTGKNEVRASIGGRAGASSCSCGGTRQAGMHIALQHKLLVRPRARLTLLPPLLAQVNGTLKDKDFVLINGGWQPRWTMPAGKWQRTRWAHTGFKRFMELTITKKNPAYTAINGLPQFIHAPECEIKLFAKDGELGRGSEGADHVAAAAQLLHCLQQHSGACLRRLQR